MFLWVRWGVGDSLDQCNVWSSASLLVESPPRSVMVPGLVPDVIRLLICFISVQKEASDPHVVHFWKLSRAQRVLRRRPSGEPECIGQPRRTASARPYASSQGVPISALFLQEHQQIGTESTRVVEGRLSEKSCLGGSIVLTQGLERLGSAFQREDPNSEVLAARCL